ncbi:MAG: glucosaminidase domain-containing protein [Thermoleophilia bacterium]
MSKPASILPAGHGAAGSRRATVSLLWALLGLACLLAAPGQAAAVSPSDPIRGISTVTPSQLEGRLSSVNPGHIHPDIANLYVEWGYRFGIRADVAFAQMLHETNFLRYGGDVRASQNNLAGIGATGGGNPGNSFVNLEAGVIAHYAHLAWYAYPDHRNEYCNSGWDPRHFGVSHAFTAPRIGDLAGRWAVPGTGYGEAIARYATEIHGFPPRGKWLGSFNEVAGVPGSGLSTEYLFTWYDSTRANGMRNNWILIGNQGADEARVEIHVGSRKLHDPANPANDFFTIPAGGRITPSFRDLMGGPVRVVSLEGQPLIVSQRVLYGDSFTEVMGLPVSGLSDSWEFTWYDSVPRGGIVNNWILVSNRGDAPADVDIYIGDALAARYAAARGNALPPGAIVTPRFPGVTGGPVRVVSTNHQPLIASQRILFGDSFNEVIGTPTSELASTNYFTWYDANRANGMSRCWVLVANRGDVAADVEIRVGGVLKASYTAAGGNALPPGGIVTPEFPGLTDGPVTVVATNGQPLIVSQRTVFRDSFEELPGIRPSMLATDQWFTWYDSRLVNYMRGNWILVANHGSGDATVEIHIGGVKMRDPDAPANDFFTIPEGGRITPRFENAIGGPVYVRCLTGQPLLTSQRVLYKDGLIR